MFDGQALTIWAIRLSLVFFFVFAIIRITQKQTSKPNSAQFNTARWLWTVASALYLVHVLCAFHFIHHWSHAAAIEHTAATTERFVGLRFGGGIWFNHLFTVVCVNETILMWLNPKTFAQRPKRINWVVYGYFLFIAINGAVVFVTGPVRWISLFCFLTLLILFVNKNRKYARINPQHSANEETPANNDLPHP